MQCVVRPRAWQGCGRLPHGLPTIWAAVSLLRAAMLDDALSPARWSEGETPGTGNLDTFSLHHRPLRARVALAGRPATNPLPPIVRCVVTEGRRAGRRRSGQIPALKPLSNLTIP